MKKYLLKKAINLWFFIKYFKERNIINTQCNTSIFRSFIFIIILLLPLTIIAQTQIGTDIYGEGSYDFSGFSVSMSADGTIVAIGAPYYNLLGTHTDGYVRVYKNNAGTWTQVGGDLDGEAVEDQFGFSVSMSADGTIIAIGAPYNDENGNNSGHVRVYQNNAGTWTQIGADIDGEFANAYSGASVSMNADGTIVAIGTSSFGGGARIYQNNAGTWSQVGVKIDGYANSVSISADGSMVAIGASSADSTTGTLSGRARVYQNNAGTWTQVGADINGEAASDFSGYSVSMSADGTIIAIGAHYNDGIGENSGHVRVYQNNAGTWTQIGTDIDGEAAYDRSGSSVSISTDGTIVAIGAPWSSPYGHVRVYKNIAGTWTQAGEDIDGKSSTDFTGTSVSMSTDGSIVAIGSPENDEYERNAGCVRVYDLSSVLGIDENEMLKNAITIYPNPVRDYISINNSSDALIEKLSFFDVQGRKVKNVNGEFEKISINALSDGLYFLKIKTDKGIATKKLLVNK